MKILYICTHNACRSILAEAITNKIAGQHIIAKSAGSNPRGKIQSLTIEYLKRHRYQTDDLKSKSWDDFEDYNPDIVVTLCDSAAGETCPVYFKDSLKIHWGLQDPSKDLENADENFDTIIDILETRIHKIFQEDFEDMNREQLNDLFHQVI
jgi:arsenate reductase (thioredoxin)